MENILGAPRANSVRYTAGRSGLDEKEMQFSLLVPSLGWARQWALRCAGFWCCTRFGGAMGRHPSVPKSIHPQTTPPAPPNHPQVSSNPPTKHPCSPQASPNPPTRPQTPSIILKPPHQTPQTSPHPNPPHPKIPTPLQTPPTPSLSILTPPKHPSSPPKRPKPPPSTASRPKLQPRPKIDIRFQQGGIPAGWGWELRQQRGEPEKS